MSRKQQAKLESDLLKAAVSDFHAEDPANLGMALGSMLQTYAEGILARFGEMIYDPGDLERLEEGFAAAFKVFEKTEIVDYVHHRDILSFLIGYLDEKSRHEEAVLDDDLLH